MARNRIFISYSHADQSYLDEFRSYLKFWEDKALLDVWVDPELQAGQDWHKEIQQAIDSAGIGVLLISTDFLNSSYIREHELEPLLRARAQEKTALTCLYLRPSAVADPDCVFPAGQGNNVRLTQYQGLNAPDKPVSSCQGDERERLYLRAVRQLRDLARQVGIEAEPVSRPSGERQQELTICLQVRGDRIYALYSSPSEPLFAQDYLECRGARSASADWLANGALPREAESLGSALFTLLFGPAEKGFCNRIISRIFDSDQTLLPNRYPLRVRLQTDDPLLRQLPWRQTSWQDRPLWEDGWTFECLPSADTTEPPQYSDIQLSTPCEMLIVAPEDHGGPLRSDPHCLGLEQLFQTLWSEYAWPWLPLRVASRQELEHALKERSPRIVYYYGPAEANGLELVLLLRDSQKLTLRELGAVWARHPPKALFLNLAGRSLRQSMGSVASVLPAVPFAAVQVTSSDDTLQARQSGIRWLEGLLRGHDPVWALHAYGLPDASAWSAYRRWQALSGIKPTSADLIELLLDRHNQRGLFTTSIKELIRSRDHRLLAVVVHGEPGNRVENFATQLFDHLRRNDRDSIEPKRLALRLPSLQKRFDQSDIEQMVRRHFGMEPRERLIKHLERNAPERTGKAFPVVLLDWKMDRCPQDFTLFKQQLTAWLTFCRDELAHDCPDGLRLVSYLAVERPIGQAAALQQILDSLERQFRGDWTFAFESLPPLEKVTEKDLDRYFRDLHHCNCPDNMRTRLPCLIYCETGGEFDSTVQLLQDGAKGHWHDLYDHLKQKWDKQCGIPDIED